MMKRVQISRLFDNFLLIIHKNRQIQNYVNHMMSNMVDEVEKHNKNIM